MVEIDFFEKKSKKLTSTTLLYRERRTASLFY